MSRLLEIPVDAGGSIKVEIEDGGAGHTMRGGDRGSELIERSSQTLEGSVGAIAPALRGLLDELRRVSSELSEIELELGLKLTGEAGMVVARAGAEANFLVRVRWTRTDGKGGG
jgi:hypothetical protein